MERVVNVPGLWETEFICDGGEYGGDSEWAFSFGRKLGVWERSSKVSSFEPDFVTFLEWSEGAPVPGFHGLTGEFMGCKGFLAGSIKGGEAGFDGRDV